MESSCRNFFPFISETHHMHTYCILDFAYKLFLGLDIHLCCLHNTNPAGTFDYFDQNSLTDCFDRHAVSMFLILSTCNSIINNTTDFLPVFFIYVNNSIHHSLILQALHFQVIFPA